MPARTPFVALGAYVSITVIFGRDVLWSLGSTIANDPGDPLLTAAILHWNAHHVPWTDAWWQFPIFYPTRDALAFSEHLLGVSVIASPIAWITGNPLTTYNVTMLLTFPLCAMAMYALVYRLTRDAAAAFVAGLAYGFAPYRISSLPHIQMLASFWAPLALLGLHAFVESVRQRPDAAPGMRLSRHQIGWLALFGAGWVLQAMANGYMLVFFSVLVALWVAWFAIMPRMWGALAAIGAAAVAASLPLLPVLYKYLTVHARHGFERSVDEMRVFSADLAAVFCASDKLTIWGWLRVACRGEGELFPGLAVVLLFVVAVSMHVRRHAPDDSDVRSSTAAPYIAATARWLVRALLAIAAVYAVIVMMVLTVGPLRVDLLFFRFTASGTQKPMLVAVSAAALALLIAIGARRRHAPTEGFYLFAALLTWLFALGPTLTLMGESSARPGPFVLLQWIPGADGLRVPARFWLMTVLCLSVVAGTCIAQLRRRLRPSAFRAITTLAVCAMLADGWVSAIAAQPAPPDVPDAGALRDQIVLELPTDPYADITATWHAVVGGWKAINGFSGYAPNYYYAFANAAKTGDVFAPFRDRDDVYVVVANSSPTVQAIVEAQPVVVETASDGRAKQYWLRANDIHGDESSTRNVRVAAVESRCGDMNPRLAVDGDPLTRWECPIQGDHELTIDLGVPTRISALVYSVGQFWWILPDRLSVATSVDGSNWDQVPTNGLLGALITGGMKSPANLRGTLSFAPHEARYVKVRPQTNQTDLVWLVSELEVRAPAD